MERQLGLLSVVTPMYDEEDTARAFYERVAAALEGIEFELVVVDDGSRDRTAAILAEVAEADDRVKVVLLSRNFGHQPALTAGLEHARGDAVVMIDADLQDPPELIPQMVERWRAGSDVVYAVRHARAGETRFKLLTAKLFYRLFRRLSHVELELDSGDFRLMDRRALEALLSMRERNRFLRGMTVWVGFTQTALPYERAARHAGVTKFHLGKMVRFSFDALTSFSHTPLQLATLLGFVISILAFFVGVPLVIVARYAEIFDPGIPSLMVLLLLLGGIQLITVGIIGEYVGRIYDEVKQRPLYLVRDRLNIPEDQPVRDPDDADTISSL
jgi:dolichol-phosphate mannosyltransferase